MQLEIINKERLREEFFLNTFKKIVFKDNLTNRDRFLFKEWVKNYNPNLIFFEHYRKKEILFEIVKSVKSNELVINENIRWLYASKIDYLIYNFYFYKVMEYSGTNTKGDKVHGLSLYKSLSIFTDRKQAPYNPKDKKDWQNNYWTGGRKEYVNHVIGYDFGMDFDSDNILDSYSDAKKVFDFLNKFNIRFRINTSGSKGFHIVIPYEEFSDLIGKFNLDKTVKACKGLMIDLVKHLKLKKVDHHIYSPTRYLKLPYSIDARNNRVILPLSDKDFLDFKNNSEKYMDINYCKLNNLGFRGEFINKPHNPNGFKELIEYLDKNIK